MNQRIQTNKANTEKLCAENDRLLKEIMEEPMDTTRLKKYQTLTELLNDKMQICNRVKQIIMLEQKKDLIVKEIPIPNFFNGIEKMDYYLTCKKINEDYNKLITSINNEIGKNLYDINYTYNRTELDVFKFVEETPPENYSVSIFVKCMNDGILRMEHMKRMETKTQPKIDTILS